MARLQEVGAQLGLPKQEVDDVRAVIASMQADCVVADGEAVPPNPGHPAPAGDSLYARLGGAYPVALFCDRLVDALLSDRTVKIPLDAKRNEASLKYLFTELVCSFTGGPEVITCKEADETKLLIPRAAWPIIGLTARLAADQKGRTAGRAWLRVQRRPCRQLLSISSPRLCAFRN